MEAPKLKYGGTEVTMHEPKARVWRKLTELKDKDQDIDTFAEILAVAYGDYGYSTDDILDNVEVSDLIPASFAAITFVNELVESKLTKIVNDPKNAQKA